eukprot:145651_1
MSTRRSVRLSRKQPVHFYVEKIDHGPLLPSQIASKREEVKDDPSTQEEVKDDQHIIELPLANDNILESPANADDIIESQANEVNNNAGASEADIIQSENGNHNQNVLSIAQLGHYGDNIEDEPPAITFQFGSFPAVVTNFPDMHFPVININAGGTIDVMNKFIEALMAIKPFLWQKLFSWDAKYNGYFNAVQIAENNAERRVEMREVRECFVVLSYLFQGCLNKEGTRKTVNNNRSRGCGRDSFDNVGVSWLTGIAGRSWKRYSLYHFEEFNWNDIKKIFGGVDNISREAYDGRGGFYHIGELKEVVYSYNTRKISIDFSVTWSVMKPGGGYAQYAAH